MIKYMPKTYFISGHLDIRQNEWSEHYRQRIDKIIENDPLCCFVIGDARGTDKLSSKYLWNRGIKNVTIYHMFDKPINNPGFPTKGGFKSDNERDTSMTNNSDQDIAWVRSEEESKKLYGKRYRKNRISGTQKNINRRKVVH